MTYARALRPAIVPASPAVGFAHAPQAQDAAPAGGGTPSNFPSHNYVVEARGITAIALRETPRREAEEGGVPPSKFLRFECKARPPDHKIWGRKAVTAEPF